MQKKVLKEGRCVVKIIQKLTTLAQVLDTLQESIELYDKYKKKSEAEDTREYEQLFLGMRDSMIQRFEYCTDLFWKVFKLYLEDVEKVDLASTSPKGVVREAVRIRTITETEAAECIEMVMNRNQTSHIYHQELADIIAKRVPGFYKLMHILVVRLQVKSKC